MIEWTNQKHKYGPDSENGYVGRIKCFSVAWNVMSKGDQVSPIVATTRLPGFTEETSITRHKTTDEAKLHCIRMLEIWMQWTGMKFA